MDFFLNKWIFPNLRQFIKSDSYNSVALNYHYYYYLYTCTPLLRNKLWLLLLKTTFSLIIETFLSLSLKTYIRELLYSKLTALYRVYYKCSAIRMKYIFFVNPKLMRSFQGLENSFTSHQSLVIIWTHFMKL